MGTYEATDVVITRINNFEPEHAFKIIGHILVNLEDIELIRLASSPDYVLHSLVLRLKTLLGLSSSPNTVPIPTPSLIAPNPFSRFSANRSSLSAFTTNPISPKFTSLVPPEHGSVSKSCLSPRVMMGGECDINEQQMSDYFSFSRDEGLVDPELELGHGNGDVHFHTSYSNGDVCFGSEEIGFKPCHYFAKGFCKNGRNCKFLHTDLTDSVGPFVGSPTRFDGLEQRGGFMRLKAAQQQRFMAMAAAASPASHDKYINFLMQQQNHSPRHERSDFLAMLAAEQHNPSSRQIYLTFPAESTFKDEDVSEYFSTFGPVQDVRIPYQQKRMFGFVTFIYPETVRHILSKLNPHFICDSRVLVKPYKEKGKLLDKKQQHQQQFDRGDFSPCLSSSGHGSKEPCDFHLGARMFYNPHEISLRRKLEEQAELQREIELRGRTMVNLHLPDFVNNPICSGASMPLPHLHGHISNPGLSSDNGNADITGFSGDPVSVISLESQQEVDPTGTHDTDNGNGKESADARIRDINDILESALPDSLSASPTKVAAEDNLSEFSTFSTTLLSSLNNLEL
ncbi:PREDICTED: zinc finger CCCH domain-containing protein 55-like isoform X2 [Lupinus angustifolius]|uniref:zinc finger CCCH domain-containing protein 55-like isoform X2 n=1 Tax=Lupinus angustifolius TaxID=3871 RepID=UPI00092F6CA3|nr:PREDICTED: zinc finger CCCH domain-containing protein 55-like isoform X2 [Lupinus angustifolius]